MLLSLALPLAAQIDKMTPCDLARIKLHDSKLVSISGTISFDMHGMYLYSSDCRPKTPAVSVQVPTPDTVPKVGYVLSDSELQKLKPYFRLNGGSAVACGVLVGRLFEKPHFHLRQSGGGPHGNGFGPRGAFRWMLVLESVPAIHTCQHE